MDTAEAVAGAEPEDQDLREHSSGSRATWELFFVGFGALAVALAQSVLVPVLGELTEEYGASATWLLTSTLLVGAVSVPVMGRLADMYGKRLLLLVALAALAVGSVVDALSHDIGWLIVGRSIQGLSSAAVPLGISLLATVMPRHRVASSIALISAMLGVGSALGLPFAGFVAGRWDWHILFWVTAVAGALSFLGVLLVVPESRQRNGGKVDYLGALLLSAGLVCLILPLEESHEWGWGSARVLGLLAASIVIFVLFGLVETRREDPLVDLRALRKRPIMMTNLASICFGFALFASFIGTSTFIEAGKWTGYGVEASLFVGGLVMLPSALAMLLLAPIAARMIVLRGAPQTLALGALIVAIGWVVRIVMVDSLWQVVVGATVVGIGTGIGYSAIPALINAHTPPHEIAAANGLNTLFRSLGSTLATAIGASILASSTVLHIVDGEVVGGASSLTAYRWLFAVCAIAALLASALVLTIPHRREGQA